VPNKRRSTYTDGRRAVAYGYCGCHHYSRKHIKGDITIDEELDQMENWDRIEPTVFRDLDGSVHYGDLVKGEIMEDFCGRLKNAGATFYVEIEDSPEVREDRLLDLGAALQKDAVIG
jgi:hypothetical protein